VGPLSLGRAGSLHCMVTIQPALLTADLDRLLAFYTGVFGAKELMRQGDFYVCLDVGGAELGFVNEANAPKPPGPILLTFAVEDVDALLPRVRELGGTAADANDMPWGQRVAHIQDPDGNAVNLAQTLGN
jgi:predicted enzyme related to lactoylglutathione lyase